MSKYDLTLALQEGAEEPPVLSTIATGEEGGPVLTTHAIGEEGPAPTSDLRGEEDPVLSTARTGEEDLTAPTGPENPFGSF